MYLHSRVLGLLEAIIELGCAVLYLPPRLDQPHAAAQERQQEHRSKHPNMSQLKDLCRSLVLLQEESLESGQVRRSDGLCCRDWLLTALGPGQLVAAGSRMSQV